MREKALQRSLNRVVIVVGVLAAFAFAVVSAAPGGLGEAAMAGFGVLLLVLVAGGFGAGCAVRALSPRPGERRGVASPGA